MRSREAHDWRCATLNRRVRGRCRRVGVIGAAMTMDGGVALCGGLILDIVGELLREGMLPPSD